MIRTIVPGEKRLTPKQVIFVKEYIIDFNATRAGVAAGYSKKNAHIIGYQNLQKSHIKKAIKLEIEKRVKRIEVNQDAVVQELAKLAFSNMRSFVEWGEGGVKIKESESLQSNDACCVSEISKVFNQSGSNIRIRLHDKTKALEMLAKHLGMFTEKIELSGQVKNVEEQKYHIIQEIISDPEVADRIKENFRQRTGNRISQERL